MLRFTIRELVLVTLVVAMGVGWWLDRSVLMWRHEQLITSMAGLRDRLDEADPGWRKRDEAVRIPVRVDQYQARTIGGYVVGGTLFGLAILVVISVWRGWIDVSVLEDRRRA